MSDVITIARPYAKAIFAIAVESDQLKVWSAFLKNLAIIAADVHMQIVLNNPLIPKEQVAQLFLDVVGNNLPAKGENLIEELAAKKRLDILPAISNVFESCLAEHERIIDVKVVSAFKIDKKRLQRLQNALQHSLNRRVNMHLVVDRALLGGAIIYAGDQVIDGSLRGKLNRLSERLCV